MQDNVLKIQIYAYKILAILALGLRRNFKKHCKNSFLQMLQRMNTKQAQISNALVICISTFFYVYKVNEFFEEFAQADQSKSKDARVNMLRVFGSYFDFLFKKDLEEELVSYLILVSKWIKLFQQDKDNQVRDLANNFASGIIEAAQGKYNLKDFKNKISMEKVKVNSNPEVCDQIIPRTNQFINNNL